MTTTSAPAVKLGIVTAAQELFSSDPNVQVMYGIASPTAGRDGIGVGNISTEVSRPVMNRSREEKHEVDVRASVLIPSPEGQRAATERAYSLIDAVAEHYRAHPNAAAGVPHRSDSWISGYELDEFSEDQDTQTRGRYARVTATLTVIARI